VLEPAFFHFGARSLFMFLGAGGKLFWLSLLGCVTARSLFSNSTYCPQSVFMGFVWP